MRYRLLETMRQYALEKLGESGEAAPSATVTVTTTSTGLRLSHHPCGEAIGA